jgi:hypothetical protein
VNLTDKSLVNICNKIQINNQDKEFKKFEHLITVTNQAYIKVALNEFEYIKNQNTEKDITSNFDFLMNLYNKHLKEHQVMFLLLNIF